MNNNFKLEPGDVIVERNDKRCRWLYIGADKWLTSDYGLNAKFRENNYASCSAFESLDNLEAYENTGREKDVYRAGVKVYPTPVPEVEKETIRIQITGVANCGKSCVASLIEDALDDCEIEVEVRDDGPLPVYLSGAISSIAKKSKVVIETIQSRKYTGDFEKATEVKFNTMVDGSPLQVGDVVRAGSTVWVVLSTGKWVCTNMGTLHNGVDPSSAWKVWRAGYRIQ